MPIDPSEFRRIMGHFVTGVTVVASRTPTGEPCGLTANAVTSVSLDPPLVLVCIDRGADSHEYIREAGFFSVNILDADQEWYGRRFASWDMDVKFAGIRYRSEATGAPVLEGALAWVDCRVWATYPGGDHTIFVGKVVAGDAREGTPLLYYRSGFGRFVP